MHLLNNVGWMRNLLITHLFYNPPHVLDKIQSYYWNFVCIAQLQQQLLVCLNYDL